MRHLPSIVATIALLLASACVGRPPTPPAATMLPGSVPEVPREFRAVWIATVANIDWPSRPGLPSTLQRRELTGILDRCVDLNLNAVVLQVRPHGDALYRSELEPWSAYLSGAQGRAPKPAYDPLEFAVQAAHDRGLELHAWFNPFRASHPADRSSRAAQHITRRHPELTHSYGSMEWMDPAADAVQQHSLDVILDVVRRYAVDGVHFDDYFYPYPITDKNGARLEFPDDRSYARYRAKGGTLDRGDWRRDAVDRFVARVYREVKALRPTVRVGISPFGIWRPDHPRGINGLDAYDRIFADSRRWLREGWVDYFSPQLYWPRQPEAQSFPALLRWWQKQSIRQRPIWPGLAPYRADPSRKSSFARDEVAQQIQIIRDSSPTAPGSILFSAKVVAGDRWDQATVLREGVFAEQALVPPLATFGAGAPPQRPQAVAAEATLSQDRASGGGELLVHVKPRTIVQARNWVVQYRDQGVWRHAVVPARKKVVSIPLANSEHDGPVAVFATGEGAMAGPVTAVPVRHVRR